MSELRSLAVLNILSDPLIEAFADRKDGDVNTRTHFLRLLYEQGAEENFAAYVADAVLTDDNAFSRACAGGKHISSYLWQAYIEDLKKVANALQFSDAALNLGEVPFPVASWDEETAARLQKYYADNGYGQYLRYRAFRYEGGELCPVRALSPVTLDDLKGYESEKKEVRDNFENFLAGLPYADMLLYGDRVTGKSSTVHAMINLFSDKKLRLVEIDKENILTLPALKSMLASVPMKFVVFIDDFSLRENDDRVSTLKAALQGSMEGNVGNVMIVATSNRRHIVEENFATRMDSVHVGDSEEELLSLSDRFGITVLFASVNKQNYLSIVHAIAEEMKITTPAETLDLLAERWAILRGGRSPRRARQFVDYIYACEQKGVSVEV